MKKLMTIKITDSDDFYSNTYLYPGELPYTCVDYEVDHDECMVAIRTLITFLTKTASAMMVIDLDEFEKSLAPAKEMTISEIEKALGHKIKIVKE